MLDGLRWRWWFLRRYWFLARTFRGGVGLAQAYRRKEACNRVTLRDGTSLLHPPGRGGFLQTLLEVWHERCYVPDGFYRPAEGEIIIDAGANVGLFSIWMALQAPGCRIVALEPFAENYAFLQQNLQAARVQHATAFQVALGACSGWGEMIAGGPRSLDHRLVQSDEWTPEQRVPVWSLKDLIDKIGAPRIAFLKMDIEGAEKDVFAAAETDLLARIDRVAIEYHEHLSPGVTALLKDRLEPTHSLTLHPDADGKCGILLGRRPHINSRAIA